MSLANFVFFYNTPGERTVITNQQTALGRRLLHDDFIDSEGNPTDGKSGRLTFTDDPEPGPVPPTLYASRNEFIDTVLAVNHDATYPGIII